jgi:hypothetical protein
MVGIVERVMAISPGCLREAWIHNFTPDLLDVRHGPKSTSLHWFSLVLKIGVPTQSAVQSVAS